jgi:hypothetical protein
MVRKRGLEPLQDCSHKALNLARLPVPPLPLKNADAFSARLAKSGSLGGRCNRGLGRRRGGRLIPWGYWARRPGLYRAGAARSQGGSRLGARHFQRLGSGGRRGCPRLFLDSPEHASRRVGMARHEREQERAHHERDAEHGGCLAQKRGRSASSEQALRRASGHAERSGQTAALPRLEKHDQHQKDANEKMDAQDQRVDQCKLPQGKCLDVK